MGASKIAMALAVCLAAATAHAETKMLARAGTWEAFGGTTLKGRPVCGVSQEVGGRYFGLKLYSGGDTFTVQVGTKEWKLADKAKIKVVLRFDAKKPWNATGTAFHFEDGDSGLQFNVSKSEVTQFMSEFRSSATLRLEFVGSNLADWSLSLAGTGGVSDAFLTCNSGLR
jgi:hypothetical protein